MKVWLVDPANNVPFYSACLADSLAEQGVELTFFTAPFIYDPTLPKTQHAHTEYHFFRFLGSADQQRLAARPIIRRLRRGLDYPLDWLRLLWRFRTGRPDVLHLQWSPMPRLDHIWLRLVQAMGVTVFYTVHNILPHDTPTPNHDMRRFKALYLSADALVVHAAQNRAELLSLLPELAPEKVRVIPHGPLFADRYPVEGRNDFRTELALTGPTILFFGPARPYKGLEDLIEAFALVLQTVPDAQLLIVGRRTAELEQQLKRIAALGITSQVHVVAAFVPSVDIQRYYAACDVVALPYRKVYQSGNLMTALSFALPVVATRVGGLPEVIEAAQCGLLVPPNAIPAFAGALMSLLQDVEQAHALGLNGRRFIEGEMHWSSIAQQTIQMYQAALTRKA